MKPTIVSAVVAMSLFLTACGGGGGSGGVASTPTPTPAPAPTNATLTDLRASQSFTNDASSTAVTWDLVTKTGISGSAKRTDVTISYDNAARSYTVALEGRSQTFLPADIQTSTTGDTIYRKSDGTNIDYLTLIKIPYTGTTATQYVGLGTWQHNVLSGSTQNTAYAVFTYGLPTAATAVPRTGQAGYSVDAFGLVSAPGQEPRSFQGRGQLSVDFAAGVFSSHTYLTEYQLVSGGGTSGGGIELTAAGHMSASDGTFSGNALYGGWFGSAAGTLGGRFYGPAGEELGASFSGANAAGMSVAGGFTGQRDASVTPDNLTLPGLNHEQLFYTQYGYNIVGQLNWQNAETFTFSPPSSDLLGGQFTINDKVIGGDPNFTTYRKTFSNSYDTQDVTLSLYKPGSQNTQLALTYASFGHWQMVRPSAAPGTSPTDLYFAYGLETPARLLAGKTGTASYAGIVNGTGRYQAASTTPAVLYAITGTSAFQVNFGTQAISGSLRMNGQPTGGSAIDFGRYDFAGPLAGYTAGSSTPLVQGNLQYGQIDTRFYGPDGEEIAAPFSLNVPLGNPGAGTAINGVAVAKRQ